METTDIVGAEEAVAASRPAKGLWRETLERLLRKPSALVGLTILGLLIFIAVFAPLIATHDPLSVLLDVPEEGVAKRSDPCIHLFGCPSAGDMLVSATTPSDVSTARFSTTNSLMAAASGNVITVWDTEDGEEVMQLEHADPVTGLSWTPTDQQIASASGEELHVWDINRRSLSRSLPFEGGADLVAWNADGTRLLSANAERVTIWDTMMWREIGTIELDGPRIAAEWNSNGTLLMTASGNHVRIWNAFVATEVASLEHDQPVTSATFNTATNRILSTSGSSLHVWNVATYEELLVVEHDGSLTYGAWQENISRGVRRIMAASDSEVLIWDVDTGEHLLTLEHGEPVLTTGSSPLATRIFTQGEQSLRIWNAEDGSEVLSKTFDAPITSVEWQNAGGGVLLASGDELSVIKTSDYQYVMGIDGNLRDQFSRVIYGTRLSLMVGFSTVTFAALIGVFAGAVAGFLGGWVDNLIMRIMDVVLAFPPLILAIAVVTVLGPGLINALLAISIVSIPAYARVARSGVLAVKEEDFVMADRALGVAPGRILFRRVLPNAMAPLIVQATLGIGTAILDAAALSFLGLGAQPPTPEWGAMLGAERNQIFTAPHLVFYPGIAIMLTVLAFNLLGDGLRDALDPRLDR